MFSENDFSMPKNVKFLLPLLVEKKRIKNVLARPAWVPTEEEKGVQKQMHKNLKHVPQ